MARHRRPRRPEHLVRSPQTPVEERDEVLVVRSVVGEDERLERGVTLLPGLRALPEERAEIIEVGRDARVADLIYPREVPAQPKCAAESVLLVLVGRLDRPELLDEMAEADRAVGHARLRKRNGFELDPEDLG